MNFFLRILALICLLFAFSAEAKTENIEIDAFTKVVDSDTSKELDYQEIAKQLGMVEDALKTHQATSQNLNDYVKILSNYNSQLFETKKLSEKELQFVQKRIEVLGEAPKEGGELETIAQKRKEFASEEAFQKAKIAEMDILVAKIDELENLISVYRNQKLLGNLLVNQEPLIYPQVLFPSTKL